MTTPSASVLARRRNARAALDLARADGRVLSNVELDEAGRDARDWLVKHGWKHRIRHAVSAGLVLLMEREREREKS